MAHAFEWGKLSKCHFKGKTNRKWVNGLKIYDSEKFCCGLEYYNVYMNYDPLMTLTILRQVQNRSSMTIIVKSLLVYIPILRRAFTGPLVL